MPGLELLLDAGQLVGKAALRGEAISKGISHLEPVILGRCGGYHVVTALVEEVDQLSGRPDVGGDGDGHRVSIEDGVGPLDELHPEAFTGAPVDHGSNVLDGEAIPPPGILREAPIATAPHGAFKTPQGAIMGSLLVEEGHGGSLLLRSRCGCGGHSTIHPEDLQDRADAVLVNALGQLQVIHPTALGQLRPGSHPQLTGQVLHEGSQVGALNIIDLLQLAGDILRHLLHHGVELLLPHLLHLAAELGVGVKDVSPGDLVICSLRIGVEGNSGLRPDIAEAHRVEVRVTRLIQHAGGPQGIPKALPRTTGGGDLAGLRVPRGVAPLLVLGEEVADEGGHVVAVGLDGVLAASPGDEILRGRGQVDGPEAIQQGGVHLVDGVGRRGIDGRKDSSLRVQQPAVELPVKDHLESCLHHLRGGPVQLVEEEDPGIITGILEPGRRVEAGHLPVGGGQADHVALRHLGEAAIDDVIRGEAKGIGRLTDHLRLADAMGAAEED